ncbi:MAG: hypothetical protein SFW66_03665 [Gammaproteobacteria bacterium]|nr:hypothetical protein [Gammaproteobacteria bacterium]
MLARFYGTPQQDINQPKVFTLKNSLTEPVNVNDVYAQATETVWLRAILSLSGEQLGLKQLDHVSRFKAIMVLLFHELITQAIPTEKAAEKLAGAMSAKLLKQMLVFFLKMVIYSNPFSEITKQYHLSNDEKLAKFDKLFSEITNKFFNEFTTYGEIQSIALLKSDVMNIKEVFLDPMAAFARRIALLFCKIKDKPKAGADNQIPLLDNAIQPGEVDLQLEMLQRRLIEIQDRNRSGSEFDHIAEEIQQFGDDFIAQILMFSVTKTVAKFNFDTMREIYQLNMPENLIRIKQIAKENKFPYLNDTLSIQKKYIDYHVNFLHLYENTCSFIADIFPGFSEETFKKCYEKAFECFSRPENQNSLLINTTYELYLMMARYPQYQMEIQKTVTMLAGHLKISLKDMSEILKHESEVPLSLQEIILWAKSAIRTGASPYIERQKIAQGEQVESKGLIPVSLSFSFFTSSEKLPERHYLSESKVEMLVSYAEHHDTYKKLFDKVDTKKNKKLEEFFSQHINQAKYLEQLVILSGMIKKSVESAKLQSALQKHVSHRAESLLNEYLHDSDCTPQQRLNYLEVWQSHIFFEGFFMQRRLENVKEQLIKQKTHLEPAIVSESKEEEWEVLTLKK